MRHPGESNYSSKILRSIFSSMLPLAFSMPAILAGIFVSVSSIVTSTIPAYLGPLEVLLYAYWAICLFQMERVVRRITVAHCGTRWLPTLAVLAICSPAAPTLVSNGLDYAGRLLVSVTELIAELFPNSSPIANNALLLLTEHSMTLTFLGGFFVCAVGQYKLLKAADTARDFCYSHNEQPRNTVQEICHHPLAAFIALVISIPGVFWLLGETSMASAFGLRQDFIARAHLVTFICFGLAFISFYQFSKKLSGALSHCESTPPVNLKLAA